MTEDREETAPAAAPAAAPSPAHISTTGEKSPSHDSNPVTVTEDNASLGDRGSQTSGPPEDGKCEQNSDNAEEEKHRSDSAGQEEAKSESEEGEVSEDEEPQEQDKTAKIDNGGAPPLPAGPPPGADDGWEYHWDPSHQAWFFYNRYTQQTTWENPRQQPAEGVAAAGPESTAHSMPGSVAGGYNPAIHGDYDPNAWYAQPQASDGISAHQQQLLQQSGDAAAPYGQGEVELGDDAEADPSLLFVSGARFNNRTGQFQEPDQAAEQHADEAKSRRQMNAFFDVDAAANAHGGRSLRAERAGKKPSKAELKQFKEKRKARKEEKRRAWLRD